MPSNSTAKLFKVGVKKIFVVKASRLVLNAVSAIQKMGNKTKNRKTSANWEKVKSYHFAVC